MVFSSVPLYLDPPNWQQLSNQQLQGHHEQNQHHLMSPPQQQQQTPQPQPNQMGIISGGGGNMGPQAQQIRANSMSERARLAKIPPPEVPQKCPRCDSTNTKFCYYNNYSLSQPRHFCKTCRRYWTRGGALRNVPVGGGCRRNKRSSSSKSSSSGGGATSSKSTTSMVMDQLGNNSDPRGINVNSLNGVGNSSSMSFMASLQNIAQLGGMSNMGLNFGGVNSNSTPLGVGGNYSNNHHNNLEFPQQQQQQVVQFPNFLGGFEIPSHQFQNLIHNHHNNQGVGGGVVNEDQDQQEGHMNVVNTMSKGSNSSVISSVKMEENGQLGRINIAKQLMRISSSNDGNNNNVRGNDNQFWGGHGNMTNNVGGVTSMWTDLSGLSSSSTSQLL